MLERSQFARHAMRPRASFHNQHARVERGEEFDELLAPQLLATTADAVPSVGYPYNFDTNTSVQLWTGV